MARRATAQDVADLAGVSRSAVSLVLNGRGDGNIAAHKQRAIVEAARRLEYTPNAVALSLRSRRTRTLGVLTWPGAYGFPEPLLSAVLGAATDANYAVLMADASRDEDEGRRATATLRDRQVDALLIIAPEMTELELDNSETLPTVLVNCVDRLGGYTSLVPDDVSAGIAAVAVLVDAGHRRIGLLTGPADRFVSEHRATGVRRALAAGSGTLTEVQSGQDIASGFAAARELFAHGKPPTAVICTHERLAVGAALAAGELGLAVPRDVSLISFEDGEMLGRQLVPAQTTIVRPDQAMAEQAVKMLIEQVGLDGRGPAQHLSFHCPLVSRESVAPRVRREPGVAARTA